MEYQFTHTMHGVVAKCSMEHEAFAHWLNIEVVQHHQDLAVVLNEIARCKAAYPNYYEWVLEGREYSLYIDHDEVIAKANNLDAVFDDDPLEDGMQFYNEESLAFCGLDDFERFLNAYLAFSTKYH